MSELMRGANAPLTKEHPTASFLTVGVSWSSPDRGQEEDLRLGALPLTGQGKVLTGEDLVFASQLQASTTKLVLEEDKQQFDLLLASVPPEVEGVAFVAWSNRDRKPLSLLSSLKVRILVEGRQVLTTPNLAPEFSQETACYLVQLYRHQEEWKVRCKAEGWQEGLPGLLKAFGVRPA